MLAIVFSSVLLFLLVAILFQPVVYFLGRISIEQDLALGAFATNDAVWQNCQNPAIWRDLARPVAEN
jgi:hypothetical protein